VKTLKRGWWDGARSAFYPVNPFPEDPTIKEVAVVPLEEVQRMQREAAGDRQRLIMRLISAHCLDLCEETPIRCLITLKEAAEDENFDVAAALEALHEKDDARHRKENTV